MFCKKCGNQLPDYATFCDKCGANVEGSVTPKARSNKIVPIAIGAGAVAIIALVIFLIIHLTSNKSDGDSRTTAPETAVKTTAPIQNDYSDNIIKNTTTAPAAVTSSTEPEPAVSNPPYAVINGVNVKAVESGYSTSDTSSTVELWGENDNYIYLALINVPHKLLKFNTTYEGEGIEADSDPLAVMFFFYDVKSGLSATGMTGDGISNQVIKIGDYSSDNLMNLSVEGNIYTADDNKSIPFTVSGSFNFVDDIEQLNTYNNHFSAALSNAMTGSESTNGTTETTEPAQTTTVNIAGTDYPIDTEYLSLGNKGLKDGDLENVKYLSNLKQIHLNNNLELTDISPLRSLTKLELVYMDNTAVSDISPLENCKNLKELGIKNTHVNNISVISNFGKLEKLVAGECYISDISPVADCPEMRELWLSYNPISDFSPVSELKKLDTVGLDNCCKMTWEILETLYGIGFVTRLELGGNSITDEMAEELSYNLYSPGGKGVFNY